MKNIIQGIAGAEGPAVSRDGRIFMVAPNDGRVIEVLGEKLWKELAHTGGVPAGLQFDRNNDLWVADMQRGILRVGLDGRVYPEVTTFAGQPIRGCNDCYFDSKGNLYFSAPAGSSATNFVGQVFCRLTSGEVFQIDSGYGFSNGLAVTADDRTLIVAETLTRKLWAYNLDDAGRAGTKRLWSTLPVGGRGPDGMDFDAAGNLLVAYFGGSGIEIFSPGGTWLRRIDTPFENVTNVHFNGAGSTSLLVTETSDGGLWSFDYDSPGQKQYAWT